MERNKIIDKMVKMGKNVLSFIIGKLKENAFIKGIKFIMLFILDKYNFIKKKTVFYLFWRKKKAQIFCELLSKEEREEPTTDLIVKLKKIAEEEKRENTTFDKKVKEFIKRKAEKDFAEFNQDIGVEGEEKIGEISEIIIQEQRRKDELELAKQFLKGKSEDFDPSVLLTRKEIKDQIKNIKGINVDEKFERIIREDFFFGEKLEDAKKENYILFNYYGKERGIFQINNYLYHPEKGSYLDKRELFNIIYPVKTTKTKKGKVIFMRGDNMVYTIAPLRELKINLTLSSDVKYINSDGYGRHSRWVGADGYNFWERYKDYDKAYMMMSAQRFYKVPEKDSKIINISNFEVIEENRIKVPIKTKIKEREEYEDEDEAFIFGTDWGTISTTHAFHGFLANKKELNNEIRKRGRDAVLRHRINTLSKVMAMDNIRSKDNIHTCVVGQLARLKKFNLEILNSKKKKEPKTKKENEDINRPRTLEEVYTELLGEEGLKLLSPGFRNALLEKDSPIENTYLDLAEDPTGFEDDELEDEISRVRVTDMVEEVKTKNFVGSFVEEEYKDKLKDAIEFIEDQKEIEGLSMELNVYEKRELREIFGDAVGEMETELDYDLYEEMKEQQEYFKVGSDGYHGFVDYTFLKKAQELENASRGRVFRTVIGFFDILSRFIFIALDFLWLFVMSIIIIGFWYLHIWYALITFWIAAIDWITTISIMLIDTDSLFEIEYYTNNFHKFMPKTPEDFVKMVTEIDLIIIDRIAEEAGENEKNVDVWKMGELPKGSPIEEIPLPAEADTGQVRKLRVTTSHIGGIKLYKPRILLYNGLHDTGFLLTIVVVFPLLLLIPVLFLFPSELEELEDDEGWIEEQMVIIKDNSSMWYTKPFKIMSIYKHISFFYKIQDKYRSFRKKCIKVKTRIKEENSRRIKSILVRIMFIWLKVWNNKVIKGVRVYINSYWTNYVSPVINKFLLDRQRKKAKKIREQELKKFFRRKQILTQITELRELKKLVEMKKYPFSKFDEKIGEFFKGLDKKERHEILKIFSQFKTSTLLGGGVEDPKKEQKRYYKFMFDELDQALECILLEEKVSSHQIIVKFMDPTKMKLADRETFTTNLLEKECVLLKNKILNFVSEKYKTGEEIASKKEEIEANFRAEINKIKASRKFSPGREFFWFWGDDFYKDEDDNIRNRK